MNKTLSTLILMSMASPLALNMIIPLLPNLAQHFQVSHSLIQMSVSLYLIALAVGQLSVGVMINALGQSKTILIGLSLFLIGGMLIWQDLNIYILLVSRVLQGLGGAILISNARSLLVLTFGKEQSSHMMGYIVMAIALAQSIAPLLGSYLSTYFGWPSIGLLSAVQAFILILAFKKVIQGHIKPTTRLGLTETLIQYRELLQNTQFRTYTGANTLIACCFYIFVASAPYLIPDTSHSPELFGYWFICISASFLVGGFCSTRLNKIWSVNKTINAGNVMCVMGAILLLLTQLIFPASYAMLFLPMSLVTFGRGISQPSYQSAGVGALANQTTTAAGLMGFLQLSMGALISQLAPWLITFHSSLFAACILAFCAAAAIWHFCVYKTL
ncbi:MFS transporter [Marinomonas fungiae]|uniref:Predicted arabinose efflux permease, MFS family n=1 Tax=Marinomonas fungiae TaxID=1137284 RepID=A0A0K6ILH7_9GAMM|nr:MFS transporter [Marinomonas fungiae]CUB04162.1 Predicted arabinose efflux permease, MFS family [Marinomonas fungiae]